MHKSWYSVQVKPLLGLAASDVPTITTPLFFFVSTNLALSSSSFSKHCDFFLTASMNEGNAISPYYLHGQINDILPLENPFDLCFMCTSSMN